MMMCEWLSNISATVITVQVRVSIKTQVQFYLIQGTQNKTLLGKIHKHETRASTKLTSNRVTETKLDQEQWEHGGYYIKHYQ